ncbi:MAG: MBL fold metallo-hydrolase [Clostridia bacterium]|nr:MBL fold metallo-hydrolase [Clostridia bacterium]
MSRLHFLKSVTDTINTSFILESGEELLVVDGGFGSEAPYLQEYIAALGGHVNGWFITHFHNDHFEALLKVLSVYSDITVDKIYCAFPSDDFIVRAEPMQGDIKSEKYLALFRKYTSERGVDVCTVKEGDVYSFDGDNVTVRVLCTPDESILHNPINNSSTVYRFETNGKSILFLGDLGEEGGERLMRITSPELMCADYLQMAHHGQNGVKKECYEAIRPTYCLWPTPSWLWDNYGKGGYDTGIYNTVVTRGWISSMHCVKRHYLMTDGTQVIDLSED